MSKPLQVGSEIDAYCTQCKEDRVHVVVALVGTTPKKVQCRSCNGTHLYRPTKAQKEAAAAHKRASKPESSSSSRSSSSRSKSAVAPKKREEDALLSWEKATSGHAPSEFKPYRIDATFVKGDLIRHAKFGEGVVATVIDAAKLEILFRDGPRTLAYATQLN
jgi:hypothetical protein